MPRTKHHDLINKDYFGKIKYIRELESLLGRKLSKFEKDFIEDTFRTLLIINNEWSGGNKSDVSFEKNKNEMTLYVKKYENTYQKSPDSYCIELYNKMISWLDEMNEKEHKKHDKFCNGIKSEITAILEKLDYINFDYDFNGFCYYKRNPNNKSKRHYISLLDYEKRWMYFAFGFNRKHIYIQLETNIDKNNNGETYIRDLFRTYADLSLYLKNEEYEECLNKIINLSFKKVCSAVRQDDELGLALYNLEEIAYMIIRKEYDDAYARTIKFIQDNEDWYVRAS